MWDVRPSGRATSRTIRIGVEAKDSDTRRSLHRDIVKARDSEVRYV